MISSYLIGTTSGLVMVIVSLSTSLIFHVSPKRIADDALHYP